MLVLLNKDFYHLHFSREEGSSCHTGEASWCSGKRQEQGESLCPSLLWDFHGKGKARQDRVNSLGLANLNNSGRLWIMVVVSTCLIPVPGLILGRGNFGLMCESQISKWLVCVGEACLQIN